MDSTWSKPTNSIRIVKPSITNRSVAIIESAMLWQIYLFELNQLHNSFYKTQLLCVMISSLFALIAIGYDFITFIFSYARGKL